VLRALDTKLIRDLLRLRGQVVTIALVVASGIASFVTLQGNYASLARARDAFYDAQRFADVFAELERAPEELAGRIATLPGVARAMTRVKKPALVTLDSRAQPLRAEVLTLPSPENETLNAVRLAEGRRPRPDDPDEIVLLAGFAEAHRIVPGQRLPAVVNGTKRSFHVVGTATSPEYVLAMSPGGLSADPAEFAVLWMTPRTIEAAFGMEQAFNQVSLELIPGASPSAATDALDRLLEPYGGLGAKPREKQPSNYMLESELEQLRGLSTFLPLVFLGVAALLVNVVLSRLIYLQQPEIATLKALGYSNREIGSHFLKLVVVVALLGAAAGIGAGAWLGKQMTELYADFFKLPDLAFHLAARDAWIAAGTSALAAALGALGAVRRAVRMPPAEAMRPPAPARYRRSLADRLHVGRLLGPSAQMVVRELERRPLRPLLSAFAIAAGTALTVVGGWYYDGIRALVETQFHTAMREDVQVSFLSPVSRRALGSLEELPGVNRAEGLRAVPVRFRSGPRVRDGALWGYPDDTKLRTVRDRMGRPRALPPDGVVLTDKLAEVLGIGIGNAVRVEILEGQRGTLELPVTGLVDESFGLQGHMMGTALARALGQPERVSLALLETDPEKDAELDRWLKELPQLAGVSRRQKLLDDFEAQSGSMMTTMAVIIALFAATITVGVVYNNARIALSLRGREFASLRVLGFTRGEISAVLLGELAVQVLVAIPVGLFFGGLLVAALAQMVDPEVYRLPLLLTPRTFAFAASVTLAAAVVSALLVRRRVDRLDLIAVLKTRE
jgi:putative ABC transport system permease protein